MNPTRSHGRSPGAVNEADRNLVEPVIIVHDESSHLGEYAMEFDTFIGIDPAYSGKCGYAVIRGRMLLVHGTFKPSRSLPLEEKVDTFLERIEKELQRFLTPTTALAVEYPQPWNTNASRKGVLIHLGYVCGRVYEWAKTRVGQVMLITPSQWKGQVPKGVTIRWAKREYGLDGGTDHEADATGIADFLAKLLRSSVDG